MAGITGYPSNTLLDRSQNKHATIQPIRLAQNALDVYVNEGLYKVAEDAVEASSTVAIINATAHVAQVGDIIKFTSGTHNGKEVRVSSTATNTITLAEDLSAAPSAAVTFEILRHMVKKAVLDGVHQLSNNCASTNITTGAYVQLAATLNADCEQLLLVNKTSSILILAVGGAGSEVDKIFIPSTGDSGILVPLRIAKGSRVSVKALDANATTAYLAISVLG